MNPQRLTSICQRILLDHRAADVPKDVVRAIIELISQTPRACLYLIEDEAVRLVAGFPEDPGSHGIGTTHLLRDLPATLEVVKTKGYVLVENPGTDRRTSPLHGFIHQKAITCILQAPLVVGGEVIGVLVVDRVNNTPPFNQEEIDICMALANVAAVAIKNARLEQRLFEMTGQLKTATKELALADLRVRVADSVVNPIITVIARAKKLVRCLQGDSNEFRLAEDVLADLLEVEKCLQAITNDSGDRESVVITILVGDLLEELLGQFSQRFEERNITVKIDWQELKSKNGRFDQLTISPQALRSVFKEIIEVVVHLMPEGGELLIRGSAARAGFTVKISHAGLPMSVSDRKRIFEPLFVLGGNGDRFGLHVAASLLTDGITIRLEDGGDRPDSFVLYFPHNV